MSDVSAHHAERLPQRSWVHTAIANGRRLRRSRPTTVSDAVSSTFTASSLPVLVTYARAPSGLMVIRLMKKSDNGSVAVTVLVSKTDVAPSLARPVVSCRLPDL